ncbi:MAG: hydantoinase B/oxoprolinase family protein, partial [Paracoccaceae bacterium]|nr:hydantoinase B/oxoprolinase family protein [Paracoccaceae bacterium]
MIEHSETGEEKWLGSVFSNYKIKSGDKFTRPTAGGGGFGDPLKREPERVKQDVIDDYVSIKRAKKDYGVVIKVIDADMLIYEIDHAATEKMRADIRANRVDWARMNPETVSQMFKDGIINEMDAVRRYAVILDWGSGELMPKSTEQFRQSFERRSVAHWN